MSHPRRALALLPALALSLLLAPPLFGAATINIVNLDAGTGIGFDDPTPVAPVGGNPGTTLGAQRLNAFQHAATIWSGIINSSVPISIQATFHPTNPTLPCGATTATLGAAVSLQVFANFANAPFTNTWYHSALANSLAGVDLSPGPPGTNADDVVAFFNDLIDNPACLGAIGWYYGLDNNHGANIDLVTVLLHEFAHGFGFAEFVNETTGSFIGPPFLPDIYTRFTLDTKVNLHWNQMTNPQRVASAINTNRVVWDGPDVTAAAPAVLTPGTPAVTITSPPSIAWTYRIGAADFGPPLSSPGVSGNIILANDGVGTTTDACEAIVNGAAISGNLALVDRGTCPFTQKVANAQAVGAVGVLIADNVAGSPPAGITGVDPTITIPSVRISLADGNTIKAQLGVGVSGTLGINMSVLLGADPNGHALLWAPNPLVPGSSISHWDVIATPNLLMEPNINPDLTHGVDLTMQQLTDIGWTACGNNILEAPAEVCDGTDLGGATCASQGFTGGTLACDPTCGAFDTSGCFTCRTGPTNGGWNLPVLTGPTPGTVAGYLFDQAGVFQYKFTADLIQTTATGGRITNGILYDGLAPDPDYTVTGTWTFTGVNVGRFSAEIFDAAGVAVGRINGGWSDNPLPTIAGTYTGTWKICQ